MCRARAPPQKASFFILLYFMSVTARVTGAFQFGYDCVKARISRRVPGMTVLQKCLDRPRTFCLCVLCVCRTSLFLNLTIAYHSVCAGASGIWRECGLDDGLVLALVS